MEPNANYATERGLFDKMRGTVKFFRKEKGFGFISCHDGSPDVFVHQTGIVATGYRSLDIDDMVEFEVEQTPRGPRAIKVTKI